MEGKGVTAKQSSSPGENGEQSGRTSRARRKRVAVNWHAGVVPIQPCAGMNRVCLISHLPGEPPLVPPGAGPMDRQATRSGSGLGSGWTPGSSRRPC